MLKRFILRNSNRFLSRWIVLILDLMVVGASYQLALLLRFNLEFNAVPQHMFTYGLPQIIVAWTVGFLLARSYVGVIRHTSLVDGYSIFKAGVIGVILLWGVSMIGTFYPGQGWLNVISRSVIIIHFGLSTILLMSMRLSVKLLYQRFRSQNVKKKRVLIFGAGASGIIAKNTLVQDTSQDFEVIGFIDDNTFKVGKKIEGVPIYSSARALRGKFVEKHQLEEVIIAIQDGLSKERRNEIIEDCLKLNLRVKVVPPVESWIRGELSAKQIKNVRIEDLLERAPIELDSCNIRREVAGKVVLVTGAAGSIGSEIVRQLLHYSPEKVVLLDQAESAMHVLDLELHRSSERYEELAECVIADVRNRRRMLKVFDHFKPQVIFHAAAYKHVPLMENNPSEAVSVNLLGTKNIADLAVEFGAERFVMVSTDKAVNPTNVMGATKRAAEIYVQALGRQGLSQTQFITTRFGNVLGSNGSVIPIFRKQIEQGGPVTITHREITRYFMTIPEACNLVLEAGAMGKGGEIFVFDMGKSVKIYDLARKMIKLSGLQVDIDVEIKEIGLRPGEKLYEELLAKKEDTQDTHHPKIMIALTATQSFGEVKIHIDHLQSCLQAGNNMNTVATLKQLVPEFISNNSTYGQLDLKKEQHG